MPMNPAEREQRIRTYAEGPERLRQALTKVPDEAVGWKPAPGRWSAHEIVCHCADAETNAAARLRFLLAEKQPVIQAYDQDLWAERLGYASHPLPLALEVVGAVRAYTAALLASLPAEAWSREGVHSESGRYTVDDWLRIYSDHLHGHARQVEGNLEAWYRNETAVPQSRIVEG